MALTIDLAKENERLQQENDWARKEQAYMQNTVMELRKEVAELQDYRAAADQYLNIVHCVGNRPVVEGFVCPHCASVRPNEKCLAPAALRKHNKTVWGE